MEGTDILAEMQATVVGIAVNAAAAAMMSRDTSGDEGNDGADQAHQQTPTDVSGAEDFAQLPPVLQDSRGYQEECEKASALIQAWWRMRWTICAVVHFARVKDMKPPRRLRKALNLIIELDYYSRHLPVVHELFVRLRRCCSGGYEAGQRGASRTWRKGQDAEASTSGQASVGAIYRAHTHAKMELSRAETTRGGLLLRSRV